MCIVQVVGVGIGIIKRCIRQNILTLDMAFIRGIIPVVKIIALQIEFGTDNIILVQPAAPGRIDTAVAVAAIDTHG